MKKRGYLAITTELLCEYLHLEGQIIDIKVDHFAGGKVEIIIEHPNIRDCPEGCYPWPILWEDYQKHEKQRDHSLKGACAKR